MKDVGEPRDATIVRLARFLIKLRLYPIFGLHAVFRRQTDSSVVLESGKRHPERNSEYSRCARQPFRLRGSVDRMTNVVRYTFRNHRTLNPLCESRCCSCSSSFSQVGCALRRASMILCLRAYHLRAQRWIAPIHRWWEPRNAARRRLKEATTPRDVTIRLFLCALLC